MSRFSTPVQAVIDRLQAQIATGKILDGWRFIPVPRTEGTGVSDFPSVRCQRVTINEEPVRRDITDAGIDLVLEVATSKSSFPLHLTAVASVMDSIETATDGATDETIDGTTQFSLAAESEPSEASGNALYTLVTVKLRTKPFLRASRRL